MDSRRSRFKRWIKRLVAAETIYTFWERAEQIWDSLPKPVRFGIRVTILYILSSLISWLATLKGWIAATIPSYFLAQFVLIFLSLGVWTVALLLYRRQQSAPPDAIPTKRTTGATPRVNINSKSAAETERARRLNAVETAENLVEETRKRHVEKFRRLLPYFPVGQKRVIVDLLRGPRPLGKYSAEVRPLENKGYIKAEHPFGSEDTYLYEIVEDYRDAAIRWRDAEIRAKVQRLASRLTGAQKLALGFFAIGKDSELPWPEPKSQEMKLLHQAFRDLSRQGFLSHAVPTTSIIETFSLKSEMWPFISEHILDGKQIVRGSIQIIPSYLRK